jgi:hypothetical protein
MQRKNNILNSYKQRNAMAMIMAIIVIVIIGTIMALSISLTSLTTKRTNDLYLYEQSTLLAKSATEYALLLISQNPPCSDLNTNFTQENGLYNISIGIQYIYDSNASCIANGGTLFATVTTPEQNGSALIDVSVSVLDGNVSAEPIRYFRRTLQKL